MSKRKHDTRTYVERLTTERATATDNAKAAGVLAIFSRAAALGRGAAQQELEGLVEEGLTHTVMAQALRQRLAQDEPAVEITDALEELEDYA